jgi:hypothetical protein
MLTLEVILTIYHSTTEYQAFSYYEELFVTHISVNNGTAVSVNRIGKRLYESIAAYNGKSIKKPICRQIVQHYMYRHSHTKYRG